MGKAMDLASGAEGGRPCAPRPSGSACRRAWPNWAWRAMFPDIVRGALKDHSHLTNPRVASDTGYEAMLEASL